MDIYIGPSSTMSKMECFLGVSSLSVPSVSVPKRKLGSLGSLLFFSSLLNSPLFLFSFLGPFPFISRLSLLPKSGLKAYKRK